MSRYPGTMMFDTAPRSRTTEPTETHPDEVDIDLDRVVVDPEYRRKVVTHLRRTTIDHRFRINQQRRRDLK